MIVRTRNFDNTKCKRELPIINNCIHAWGVNEEDFETFKNHAPCPPDSWEEVQIPKDYIVCAIDYRDVDFYVTSSYTEELPLLVKYDPAKHNVWLSWEYDEFFDRMFCIINNPYQVVVLKESEYKEYNEYAKFHNQYVGKLDSEEEIRQLYEFNQKYDEFIKAF